MKPSEVERMSALIAKVEAELSVSREFRVARMERFLDLSARFQLDKARLSPPNFNLLERAGLYADERQHSAIFAWLLDATGSHGQGSLFFSRFAEVCGLTLEPNLADYTVRTEFSGSESITDILIFRKRDFLVCLENKAFADEGDEQLSRQERDLRRWAEALCIPKERVRAVFLTPQGRPPSTGDSETWRPISYAQLAEGFRPALAAISDTKVNVFVRDWLALLAKVKEDIC